MKLKIFILFVLLFCLSQLTAQKNKTEFELFLGDTINKTDNNGDKQGRWIYFGRDSKGLKNKVLKHNQIVEDGFFVNNQKNGLWKSYHTNTNKIKSEVTYAKGLANGKAKFYNEKGKLRQEGTFKNNQWADKITFYSDKDESFSKDADDKKTSVLNFSGLVTKNGKPLEDVEIIIDNYDLPIAKQTTGADGAFNIKLDLQSEYVIHFNKKGFLKNSILINTKTTNVTDPVAYDLANWKVSLSDNFATGATKDVLGFIINKPSNKIYFNKKKKEFNADGSYEHLFKKQLNDISATTQLLVASTMESNKKLEIDNLRMQSENKLKEIEMLKKEQDLQAALIKEKENELLAKKLEADKRANELALAEQEKKIKSLLFMEKEKEILEKQLEAEKKAREIERLKIITRQQQMESIMQDKELKTAKQKTDEQKRLKEMSERELNIANNEKKIADIEINERKKVFNYLLGGFFVIALFSFFLVRNIMQKKKANALLAKQAVEINHQKGEIEEKSRLIEEKNQETLQSIVYAKRIQNAILPPNSEIDPYLKDYFIFYKSKDIVSGDFYFFSDKYAKDHNKVIFAAVDCTGHGVPGAFMSMIGTEKLKDAIDDSHEPGRILKQLNLGVKSALRQSGDNLNATRDGMDLSLCTIPIIKNGEKKATIEYSGANRPLWVIKNDTKQLTEYKATKCSIGGLTPDEQEFENHKIELEKNDVFFLFSDGFADQFGGTNSKKLMTKNFKDLLVSINNKTLKDQKEHLAAFFEEWKGANEQIDDILVIGVKV
ncbi:MAG: SpoIIE family protein phosphatase [Bacteroidia bacterium]|nr:SpoIIE family protein phosphatase [Bacteroidia bacterium]